MWILSFFCRQMSGQSHSSIPITSNQWLPGVLITGTHFKPFSFCPALSAYVLALLACDLRQDCQALIGPCFAKRHLRGLMPVFKNVFELHKYSARWLILSLTAPCFLSKGTDSSSKTWFLPVVTLGCLSRASNNVPAWYHLLYSSAILSFN